MQRARQRRRRRHLQAPGRRSGLLSTMPTISLTLSRNRRHGRTPFNRRPTTQLLKPPRPPLPTLPLPHPPPPTPHLHLLPPPPHRPPSRKCTRFRKRQPLKVSIPHSRISTHHWLAPLEHPEQATTILRSSTLERALLRGLTPGIQGICRSLRERRG